MTLRQSKAQRRHTAYHEAGHAVIRHRATDLPPFYRIAIYDHYYDNDDQRLPGALGGLEVERPIIAYGRDAMADHVVYTLAGPIAEAKVRKASLLAIALSTGRDDFEEASEMIERLTTAGMRRAKNIEKEAARTVAKYWDEIVVVAEALIERGCLNYEEFLELVVTHGGTTRNGAAREDLK